MRKAIWVVTIQSDLYGSEEFHYWTLSQAQAGMDRLMEKVLQLNDGVERAFTITKEEEEEECV